MSNIKCIYLGEEEPVKLAQTISNFMVDHKVLNMVRHEDKYTIGMFVTYTDIEDSNNTMSDKDMRILIQDYDNFLDLCIGLTHVIERSVNDSVIVNAIKQATHQYNKDKDIDKYALAKASIFNQWRKTKC